MIGLTTAVLMLAVQSNDPFESRKPESRDALLRRGGGSKETEDALRRALEWLEKNQRVDHSWAAPQEDYVVGVTALAVTAFLGAGRGPESEPVRRGLQFLLAAQDKEGCVGGRGEKYMYGHILATLALAEAHGMSKPDAYGKAAQKAVDFLVSARNPDKAWRYSQRSGDNDTSVTAWAVTALRAAEQSGLTFPRTAYEGALTWFNAVTHESGRTGYTAVHHRGILGPDAHFDDHPTTTAMAVLARVIITRKKSDDLVQAGLRQLTADPPKTDNVAVDYCWWHFGSRAIFELSGPSSDPWKAWNDALKTALLKTQEEAGSWAPVDRWSVFVESRVYATAINALTLTTYYRDVRIFRGDDPQK